MNVLKLAQAWARLGNRLEAERTLERGKKIVDDYQFIGLLRRATDTGVETRRQTILTRILRAARVLRERNTFEPITPHRAD